VTVCCVYHAARCFVLLVVLIGVCSALLRPNLIKNWGFRSWSGNRSTPSTSGLHYRGQAIVDATARALHGMGIGVATEVVVGGGSAGALGVYLQVRWLGSDSRSDVALLSHQ